MLFVILVIYLDVWGNILRGKFGFIVWVVIVCDLQEIFVVCVNVV